MAAESDTSFVQVMRQDHGAWLDALALYLQEVETNILDLENKQLGAQEVESVLNLISNSQITELILKNNSLQNSIGGLSQLLTKANIRKLDVSCCELLDEDILLLTEVCANSMITHLEVWGNGLDTFDMDEVHKIISHLLQSRLISFDLAALYLNSETGIPSLLQVLPNLSLTCLDISMSEFDENILISLFLNLRHTSITSLNLSEAQVTLKPLIELSRNLKFSKVEKLNIHSNSINDNGIDILVQGLIHSKVTDLDLSRNVFTGLNTLGHHLKDTLITTLDLSLINMVHHGIFLSPDFLRKSSILELKMRNCLFNGKLGQQVLTSLKFSKVTSLDISYNNLDLSIISKFAKIVKHTNLEFVNFSRNNLSLDALIILGECIKGSKLREINLCENFKHPHGGIFLPVFLEKTKDFEVCDGSNISELKISSATNLREITYFGLNLTTNGIGDGVLNLAKNLKFSHLTSLCLNGNEITDEGVEALAQSLSKTHLIGLYLGNNQITSRGAKALALALKDSSLLSLQLWQNKIENDGIEALAEAAENTFISTINVSSNPGDRILLIDAVLWKNKVSVHRLVTAFKRIAPQDNKDFRFVGENDNENIHTFLENCLQLYKDVSENPSAASALSEEKSISLSKDSIISLMTEEFPHQLCLFIANKIEADVMEHVNLLEKAQNLGLRKIVELLLLYRPLYTIDENREILHPRVYQLLFKYNYPLYNLDIEPEGKIRIINYFTQHSDTEGASDVIRLLRGKRKH